MLFWKSETQNQFDVLKNTWFVKYIWHVMTSRNRLRLIILKKFDVLTTKKFVYDPSLQRQHNIIATSFFSIFFILFIFHLYLRIKWQYIMTWRYGITKLWQVMKSNIHTYWSLIICEIKKNFTLFLHCILVLLTLMWPFEKSSYDFIIRC